MNKKILIVMVLLSIVILSGCLGTKYVDGKINLDNFVTVEYVSCDYLDDYFEVICDKELGICCITQGFARNTAKCCKRPT